MNEAEVKAKAILIVIKTILNWIGLSILGIGVLIFFAYQYEQYKNKKQNELDDKVSIKAFHPKEGPCDKDYPYQYIIFNESGKTVEKVTFTLDIKRVGFSSNINRYTSLTEDKIIPTTEAYSRCFRADSEKEFGKNLTEKDVDIFVTYKNVDFKE